MRPRLLYVFASSAALASLVPACTWPAAPSPAVARVGGQAILQDEFEAAVARRLRQLRSPEGSMTEAVRARLRHGVLQRLIDDAVVARKAAELGIVVDHAQAERQLAAQKERFLTPAADAAAREGGPNADDEVRLEELRRRELHEQVVERLVGPVAIDDAAVEEIYSHNLEHYRQPTMLRARRIVLPLSPTATAAEVAKQRREAMRLRAAALRQPGSFADLARKHSRGPEAAHGGDMGGFFSEGHLPADLDAAVVALGPHQISLPLRTHQGWELVELLEKQPATQLPLAQVEASIRSSLMARARSQRRNQVERALRAAVPVEIVVNLAQIGAAVPATDPNAPTDVEPLPSAPPADSLVPPVPAPPPGGSPVP